MTNLVLFSSPENVVVNETVVPEESELVLHIFEQSSYERGEVDHVRRLVLVKDGHGCLEVSARCNVPWGRGGHTRQSKSVRLPPSLCGWQ